MNIIEIYNNLKSNYKSYIGSFISIKDDRIRQKVNEAIQKEHLWPKALIQFNPSYVSGEEIIDKARQFAQTEQDKIIKSLEESNIKNETDISILEGVNKKQTAEIEKLKNRNSELHSSYETELKHKDLRISKLENTIEEQKLRNWKILRFIILLFYSIILLIILALCFIYKSENWNIINKLIVWIDSLGDTLKDIAKAVFFGIYAILTFFNLYSWIALLSIKQYEKRKGWLKNVCSKLWHKIDK